MAVTFFEAESIGSGSLPFPDEYLEKNPKENGKIFTITEFSLVKSGKGYLFKTDVFCGFLWRKQKTTNQVVEALEYYCSQPYGFALVCKLDKDVKGFCVLGVDTEQQTSWYALGNGYTTQEQLSSSQEQGGNPFIHPVPLTSGSTSVTPFPPSTPGTSTRKRRSAS